jgi:DNA-binding NtrC family response regulator
MGQSAVVLVVEDEFILRVCAAELLEDAGFHVLQAAGRDEAMMLLATDHIDTLFTDVDMRSKDDGLALAWEVAFRWPHIQIIVTSGNVSINRRRMPAQSDFLAKPYDIRRVIAVVNSLH